MTVRVGEGIVEYLRVSGPTTAAALASHFTKGGADVEDVRVPLEALLREGRVAREGGPTSRFRAKA